MSRLNQSLKPVASFVFENKSENNRVLCLIPGHYNTAEIKDVTDGEGEKTSIISYADPTGIVRAGYQCDQVADDYSNGQLRGYDEIEIRPKSERCRYRDFLNYIKFSGLRVTHMRITDLNVDSSHEIFNQELEISASAIGAKAGSDFIQLSSYIDASNYIQRFIDVDLTTRNLVLDETTLAFLKVPASAHFQIDFTLG